MCRAHLFERDEFVEHIVVEHERHGAIARIGLESEETFRCIVGFHVAHARRRDEAMILFAVGGESHSAVEEHFEVGPHLIDGLCTGALEHFHQHGHHPRGHACDGSHIFVKGFFGDEFALRSKSSSKAVLFEGTRKRRTKGEAFSLRIALKSPTREEGES